MPIYLDTRGNSVLSVAICDRCNRKFAYTELMPDPNFPGMRVCKDDLDQFDPWRLPAIQTENIALRFPRPDVSLARTDSQLLTQGNLNNYSPGNSIFIDGVPPYGGAQGDVSLNGNGYNNQGNYPNPTPPSAPTVTGFSPTSGSEDGGTVVTITGTNFSGASTVQFGSTYAQFTVVNDTTIEATAPQGILNQSVRITVTTQGGKGVSAQQFTYTAGAPRVYSINPNTGDIAGGTSVTIGGYRFTGATSVTIGGTPVSSYTVIDDSRISATTAAHSSGIVSVAVTTPAGTGTGSNLFTYFNPHSIPNIPDEVSGPATLVYDFSNPDCYVSGNTVYDLRNNYDATVTGTLAVSGSSENKYVTVGSAASFAIPEAFSPTVNMSYYFICEPALGASWSAGGNNNLQSSSWASSIFSYNGNPFVGWVSQGTGAFGSTNAVGGSFSVSGFVLLRCNIQGNGTAFSSNTMVGGQTPEIESTSNSVSPQNFTSAVTVGDAQASPLNIKLVLLYTTANDPGLTVVYNGLKDRFGL